MLSGSGTGARRSRVHPDGPNSEVIDADPPDQAVACGMADLTDSNGVCRIGFAVGRRWLGRACRGAFWAARMICAGFLLAGLASGVLNLPPHCNVAQAAATRLVFGFGISSRLVMAGVRPFMV